MLSAADGTFQVGAARIDITPGYPIRLTAFADGSFRIVNGRTGSGKMYPPRRALR